MGNVTISATTANACGCCGPVECVPECITECVGSEEYLTSTICEDVGNRPACISFNTLVPCTPPPPPGNVTLTAHATLYVTANCLIPNSNYTVVVEFASSWGNTIYINTSFTATGTSENIGVVPFPIVNDPGNPGYWYWELVGCSVQ